MAWAGTDAPGVGPLREMVVEDGGTAESTIWGTETKVPAAAAALVNGTFAGALDYDGVYEKGSVHPDIVTLPAVFAVGERQGANGKDLLTALVLGNDIACRCGGAMRGNPGWFNTSVHGVFGAAAACARLLGADAQGISNAIGLALSHASGTQQALAEKSLVKRVQSGIAARGAVFSAMAAIRGISAPQAAFEGKSGFYSLYGEGDADFVIEGLGERYLNLDTVTKKFPSCTANHVAIEGAIQLATAEDFEPAVISAMRPAEAIPKSAPRRECSPRAAPRANAANEVTRPAPTLARWNSRRSCTSWSGRISTPEIIRRWRPSSASSIRSPAAC